MENKNIINRNSNSLCENYRIILNLTIYIDLYIHNIVIQNGYIM